MGQTTETQAHPRDNRKEKGEIQEHEDGTPQYTRNHQQALRQAQKDDAYGEVSYNVGDASADQACDINAAEEDKLQHTAPRLPIQLFPKRNRLPRTPLRRADTPYITGRIFLQAVRHQVYLGYLSNFHLYIFLLIIKNETQGVSSGCKSRTLLLLVFIAKWK